MNIKDMRALDAAGRGRELEGLLREQFSLRMQQATGQIGNHTNLRKVRRTIARLKTVINEVRGKTA